MTQPASGDAADYFHECDKKVGTAKLKILAMIDSTKDELTAAPPLTSFGELMGTFDIVPRILQMLHGTSQLGSSYMWLGSGKALSHKCIASLPPDMEPNWLQTMIMKYVERVRFYLCELPP